jgi:hypothetical protein
LDQTGASNGTHSQDGKSWRTGACVCSHYVLAMCTMCTHNVYSQCVLTMCTHNVYSTCVCSQCVLTMCIPMRADMYSQFVFQCVLTMCIPMCIPNYIPMCTPTPPPPPHRSAKAVRCR